MSIQLELTRLQANAASISSSKDDIMTALASKGVTVPSGATLHDVPSLIGQINGSAPEPPTPTPTISSVNIGGRDYKTVIIGNQEWLAENLDYKFVVDGDIIPIGESGNPSTPSAWYYDNDEANYGIDGTYKCGLLYNWYAAKYLDNNKSTLLPDGWHVPSNSDWITLRHRVGMSTGGTKLKAVDDSITLGYPSGWNGDDDYEFNALPAGYHLSSFSGNGSITGIWSTSEYESTYGYYYQMNTGGSIFGDTHTKEYGYSIRLVR